MGRELCVGRLNHMDIVHTFLGHSPSFSGFLLYNLMTSGHGMCWIVKCILEARVRLAGWTQLWYGCTKSGVLPGSLPRASDLYWRMGSLGTGR